jgi:hypothetical protein
MLTYADVCRRMLSPADAQDTAHTFEMWVDASLKLSRVLTRIGAFDAGTKGTCFTGTKVQILTQALAGAHAHRRFRRRY